MSVDQPAKRGISSDPPTPKRIPTRPAPRGGSPDRHHLAQVPPGEVLLLAAADPVPLPEKGHDLPLRLPDAFPVDGLGDDHADRPRVPAPDQPGLDGGDRSDDDVVLVLPLGRPPLLREAPASS